MIELPEASATQLLEAKFNFKNKQHVKKRKKRQFKILGI
jgi:hypothetical protein